MDVERCHLAAFAEELEQQERAARLRRRGFPGVQASAAEPASFALPVVTNCCCLGSHAASLLPPDIGDDPEVRLLAAVRAFIDSNLESEQQQRTMLRLSLDPSPTADQLPLRKGRAIGWFEDALTPVRV
jgi:hypothetical protein